MFHTPSIGSQLDLERSAKCWHRPVSSARCASSASTPSPPGAQGGQAGG